MITWRRSEVRVRCALTSLIISASFVGLLVGNAYYATSIGYHRILAPLGEGLIQFGFYAGLPAFIGFLGLQKLGIGWELRGRETFIESNLGFWIYCVIFYALVIYTVRQFWRRYRLRHTRISSKGRGGRAIQG